MGGKTSNEDEGKESSDDKGRNSGTRREEEGLEWIMEEESKGSSNT